MASSEILYIVTAVSNPMRWATRTAHARTSIADWLKAPNVHVTLTECQYGSRAFDLSDLASDRVTFVGVRATTLAWNKECLLNIGINHLPDGAEKIATLDADITFRRPTWDTDVLAGLDLYPVLQPWDKCYDLGPNGEHVQLHESFASLFHAGKPIVPDGDKFWTFNGGDYEYPHPGFAHCWTRRMLNRTGGLFDMGGMGSGDHHMMLGMIGKVQYSLPGGVTAGYRNAVTAWASRAATEINGKLGFVHGTIEHNFHGKKVDRSYQGRWDTFLKHGFDPVTDLKRNTNNVVEFAGNKPTLERDWDNYLRARNEDVNSLK